MSFYTAGCGKKMVVSVTGPRAANELGGPVIPGSCNPPRPEHRGTPKNPKRLRG